MLSSTAIATASLPVRAVKSLALISRTPLAAGRVANAHRNLWKVNIDGTVEDEGSQGPPVKRFRRSAKIPAPALPTPKHSAPVEVEVEVEAADSRKSAKRTRRSIKVTPVAAPSRERHSTQVEVEAEVETRTHSWPTEACQAPSSLR